MPSLNKRSNFKPFDQFRLKDVERNRDPCKLANMYTRAWEASNVSGNPYQKNFIVYGQEFFNESAKPSSKKKEEAKKRMKESKKRTSLARKRANIKVTEGGSNSTFVRTCFSKDLLRSSNVSL
eukprot:Platyproteum_vivax@DN1043_c0_g1_i1.p1